MKIFVAQFEGLVSASEGRGLFSLLLPSPFSFSLPTPLEHLFSPDSRRGWLSLAPPEGPPNFLKSASAAVVVTVAAACFATSLTLTPSDK